MRSPTLALLLALVLVATACGDDSIDLSSIPDDATTGDELDPTGADDQRADEPASEDQEPADESPADTDTGSPEDDPEKLALEEEAKQGGEELSDLFAGGEISEAAEQCMVDSLIADPDLLRAIVDLGPDADLSALPEPEQLATVDLALSCLSPEEISAGIRSGFDADVVSEALAGDTADCVNARLSDESNPDRSTLLLALVTLGEGGQPTAAQADVLVGLMTDCVDPQLLVDATLESVVDDPVLDDAVDRACIDDSVGNRTYMEQFWRLFLDNANAEFEELALDQQALIVGPFFECVSFGVAVAAGAAEDGVDLSDGTIACIDDTIDSAALLDAFLRGGPFDESQFVDAILNCLSPEELATLG